MGNYDDAYAHLINYYTFQKEFYPPISLQRALIHDKIGNLMLKKKIFDRAEKHFDKSLDIKLKILGEVSFYTVTSYLSLGEVQFIYGKYKEALDFFL